MKPEDVNTYEQDRAFPRQFPTTHWSLIRDAQQADGLTRATALAKILKVYLMPMRSYLVAIRGIPASQAEDILQDFVLAKFVNDALVSRANSSRGRFRNLLLTSLDHFISSHFRAIDSRNRAMANARSNKDLERTAESSAGMADIFDREWAQTVLLLTINKMRDECVRGQRQDIWGIFEARILQPYLTGCEPVSYDDIIQRFELRSPSQASNILVTANRMFVRLMRNVVSAYECTEDEINEEVRDLRRIIASA